MSLRVYRAAQSVKFLLKHPSRNFARPIVTNSVCQHTLSSPINKALFRQHFVNSTSSSVCVSLFHSSSFTYKERLVKCPAFAESVSEGDIHWEKAVGDTVAEDEVVAGIETDKVNVPVHAPCSGKITQFLVNDGDKVTAQQELFKMEEGAGGATASEAKPASKGKEEEPKKAEVLQHHEAPKAEENAPKKTPESQHAPEKKTEDWVVKKIETPKEVKDLHVKPPETRPPPSQQMQARPPVKSDDDLLLPSERSEHRVKMNRMRKRIAQRLKDAQNTAAMLTTFNEVDMSNIFSLRAQYKDAFLKKHQVKLGFMSAFCKASAMALKAQPEVNAVIDGEEIVYRDYVDISIAVATPKGLVVPVLRNVEHMNFAQIERGINALGEKARQNALAVEDMDGGTFTISNGGVFGSLFGTPIINPPQSAILGLHAVNQRPVVVSGEGSTAKIEARPIMYLALTYDHRLIDGREAVTFLRKIKAFIEDPRIILLDL
jgi:2-oxoglutarate dehydrogenase E2 component (dihydrolipoamide succinyltransferase)